MTAERAERSWIPYAELFGEDELREVEEAIEQGLADADAGRVVPHEEVERWLRSWGTENELPPPRPKCR
jgi:predicted transcriptional regulator